MKKTLKFISFFISICLLSTIFPVHTAFAHGNSGYDLFKYGDINYIYLWSYSCYDYDYDEPKYECSAYDFTADTYTGTGEKAVISRTLCGFDMEIIDSDFSSYYDDLNNRYSPLKEIFIPETVKEIKNSAFSHCKDLTIYGFTGSAADIFASQKGYNFIDINSLDAVAITEYKISAIGISTINNQDDIESARTAYNNLSESEKALVTNYSELVAAEENLSMLKDVISKISSIGVVTLDSETDITTARNAYDSLPSIYRHILSTPWLGHYSYYEDLTNAEYALAHLKNQREKDEKAALPVIEKINEIGTVTLESENKITVARNAYNALTAEQQKLVINYSVLAEAEAAYNQLWADRVINKINAIGTVTLESKSRITDALSAYNTLTAEQQKLVTNYSVLASAETACNQLWVDHVIDKINAIGTVTLESKIKINEARIAYNSLAPEQKGLITNYSVLVDAEQRSNELKSQDEIQKVISQIDAIGVVGVNSKQAVLRARSAYSNLNSSQKQAVTNYDKLVMAEKTLNTLMPVIDVIEQIDNTRFAGLKDEADVIYSRLAYNALPDSQKSLVNNLSVLLETEMNLNKLKGIKLGDFDGDKRISSADALKVLQISVGKVTNYTDSQRISSDYNRDDEITSLDALLILQKSVGKI